MQGIEWIELRMATDDIELSKFHPHIHFHFLWSMVFDKVQAEGVYFYCYTLVICGMYLTLVLTLTLTLIRKSCSVFSVYCLVFMHVACGYKENLTNRLRLILGLI